MNKSDIRRYWPIYTDNVYISIGQNPIGVGDVERKYGEKLALFGIFSRPENGMAPYLRNLSSWLVGYLMCTWKPGIAEG